MKIENNYLVDDPRILPPIFSPNYYDGYFNPEFGVVHYTAGDKAESAINHFLNPYSRASAHFVIWPNGNITQCVPLNKAAWHAGYSEYGGRLDLNRYSYGFEIVNPGYIRKGFVSDKVVWMKHRYEGFKRGWIEYTDEEKKTVSDLIIFLNSVKPFVDIVGHDEICKQKILGVWVDGGKTDPGPLLPMVDIQKELFGSESNALYIVSRSWGGNQVGAGRVSLKWKPYDWSSSFIWCPAGTVVRKVSWEGRWVKAERMDGKWGYCREKYLRRIKEE